MKHMNHMVGCIAMIAVVAVLLLAGDGAPSWAPLLLVLACPLMMISMMYGMSSRSRDADNADKGVGDHTRVG